MPKRGEPLPGKTPNHPDAPSSGLAELARRGEWSRIYQGLSDKDRRDGLTGAQLQSLGEAAYMLGREEEFVQAFERAYDEHLRHGRSRIAARCGFWIGLTLIFRGDFGQGSGWLGRAKRLIADEARTCAEHGYLLLPLVEQCLAANDPEGAFEHAKRAAEIGLRCGDPDLLAMARHLQGRVRVQGGETRRGFELLDEAMVSVVSGQLSPIVTGLVYCSVIDTCQKYHATGRAREWTSALVDWCAGQSDIVAFTGRCLIHRAEILILDGDWDGASREAGIASHRLQQGPAKHHAGPACYLEGEVLRLRGQWDAADAAFRAASRLGFDPQPGLALMRLRQGHGQSALSAIRRALRMVDKAPDKLRLLPAAVEITLAAGTVEEARALCDSLREFERRFPSEALTAATAEAAARVLLHDGRPEDALPEIRRAQEIQLELRAPYQHARLRLLMAQICRAIGDIEASRLELEEAVKVFRELGALPDETLAARLLATPSKDGAAALTPRQIQVVRLIAAGRTNPEIARELGLSQRTIDRHVSNILTKLDVPTRAAATAYAMEHGLITTGTLG